MDGEAPQIFNIGLALTAKSWMGLVLTTKLKQEGKPGSALVVVEDGQLQRRPGQRQR